MIENKSETKENLINEIELGDHVCSIYQDKEQQFSLLIPFFKAGLENNQKCIYLADENSKEEVIAEFVKRGIEIDKYIKSNQFSIVTKRETYLRDGYFDPDSMIGLLKETLNNTLKEGYLGMRATGEMTWVLADMSDIDKLMIYEAKLNDFYGHSKASGICQYNESKFSPDVLIQVINTHPLAIIYGNLFENSYYSSIPKIKRAAEMPMDLYRDLIKGLRNNHK